MSKAGKNSFPSIKSVRDTGIYRDVSYSSIPGDDYRTVERDAKDEKTFNFDSLLSEAERYARAIIDLYQACEGVPKAPSKTDGIFHNVERQVEYAQLLLSYAHGVRQALDRDDVEEATLYGYWVGRSYEALRVCQVEWVALRGRKNIAATRKGHAGRYGTAADKERRWAAYQKELDTIAAKNPSWSLTALRHETAERLNVSFKTIERHTKSPYVNK